MKTLHDGKSLLLKQDGDTLILDLKWGGRITRDQIALIESKGMTYVEQDSWYGDAKHLPEIERLVKLFDGEWVSREAERLAMQQLRGGR